MTRTEIREALAEVRDATEVPAVDRVDFQRRVRAERRRRTAGRVLVAGAAAAVVATVVGLSGGLAGDDRHGDGGPADGSTGSGRVSETVFFVLDGRLTALDPAGTVHDLGVNAEGVVGFTSERVYVVDDESHLVVRTVSYEDEDSGRATFGTAESPVVGPVQSTALSGDGRYLAWTDPDGVSHRYDLKAGREDLTIPGDPQSGVVDVGAEGLLLSENGDLVLRDGRAAVPVPVWGDGYGVASQVASGHVLVNDRDGRSRLYDVADGTAGLVDTLAGFGVLGPYAERVGVVVSEPADGARLEVWDGGSSRPVTGLDAVPDQLRWADETTLLVAAHAGQRGELYACDIELACERLPVDGDVNLNR